MSEADAKELVRLRTKYGADVVAMALLHLPNRGPGRPPITLERIHLASCLDDWAEEHRSADKRNPNHLARLDLYELMYGREGGPDIVRFLKSTKKKQLRGRREGQDAQRSARRLRPNN
jgi:hypothetical protein